MNRIDRVLSMINNPNGETGGLPAMINEVLEGYVDMSDSMRAMLLRDLGEQTRNTFEELKGRNPVNAPAGMSFSQFVRSTSAEHQKGIFHLRRAVDAQPANYGGYVGSFIDYINGFLSQKGKDFSFSPERAKALSTGSPFSDVEAGQLRSIGIEPRHLETMAGIQNYGDVANALQRHFAPGWMVMAYGSETNGGDMADYMSNTGLPFVNSLYGYDWNNQVTGGRWLISGAGNYVYNSIYAAGRQGQNIYKNQTAIEDAVRKANFGGESPISGQLGSDATVSFENPDLAIQRIAGMTMRGLNLSASLHDQIQRYMGVGSPKSIGSLENFLLGENSGNDEMVDAVKRLTASLRSSLEFYESGNEAYERDSSRGASPLDTFEHLASSLAKKPFYQREILPTPLPFFVGSGQQDWLGFENGTPTVIGERQLPRLNWQTPSLEEQRAMNDAITRRRYDDPIASRMFSKFGIQFSESTRTDAIRLMSEIEGRSGKNDYGYEPGSFYYNQFQEASSRYNSVQQAVLTQNDLRRLTPYLEEIESVPPSERSAIAKKYGDKHLRLYNVVKKVLDPSGGSYSSGEEEPEDTIGLLPEKEYDGGWNSPWGGAGQMADWVETKIVSKRGGRFSRPVPSKRNRETRYGLEIGQAYKSSDVVQPYYGTPKEITNRSFITPKEIASRAGYAEDDPRIADLERLALKNRMTEVLNAGRGRLIEYEPWLGGPAPEGREFAGTTKEVRDYLDESDESRNIIMSPVMRLVTESDWLVSSASRGNFNESQRPRRRFNPSGVTDWDINPNLAMYFDASYMQRKGYEGISVSDYLEASYGLKSDQPTTRSIGLRNRVQPTQINDMISSIIEKYQAREKRDPVLGFGDVPLYLAAADKWLTGIMGFAKLNSDRFSEGDLNWWKTSQLSQGISPSIFGLDVDEFGRKHLGRQILDLRRNLPADILQTEPYTRKAREEYLFNDFWRVTSKKMGSGYTKIIPEDITRILSMTTARIDVSDEMFEEAMSGSDVLSGQVSMLRSSHFGSSLFSASAGQMFEFTSGSQLAYGQVTRDVDDYTTYDKTGGFRGITTPFRLLRNAPVVGLTENVMKLLPGARASAPGDSALQALLEIERINQKGSYGQKSGAEMIAQVRNRVPYDMFNMMGMYDERSINSGGIQQAINLLRQNSNSLAPSGPLKTFMYNFFGQRDRRTDQYQQWLMEMNDRDYRQFAGVWVPIQYGLAQSNGTWQSEYSQLYADVDSRYRRAFGQPMQLRGDNGKVIVNPSIAERTGKEMWEPVGKPMQYLHQLARGYSWGELNQDDRNSIISLRASAPMQLVPGFEHETPQFDIPEYQDSPVPLRSNFAPAIDRYASGGNTALIAPTGTGKSRAMVEAIKAGIQARRNMVTVITSPTAALASQTAGVMREYESYMGAKAFHALGDPGEASTNLEKQKYKLETESSVRALQDALIYGSDGEIEGFKANRPPVVLSMSEAKAGAVLSGEGAMGEMMQKLARAGGLQVLIDEAHGLFEPMNESLPSTLNILEQGDVPFFLTTATLTQRQSRALGTSLRSRTWNAEFLESATRYETLDFGTNWAYNFRGEPNQNTVFQLGAGQYYDFAREIGHFPSTLGIYGRIDDIMSQYARAGRSGGYTPNDLLRNPSLAANMSFTREAMNKLGLDMPDFMRFFRDPKRVAPIKSEADLLEEMLTGRQPFGEGIYAQITAAVGGAGINVPNLELVQNFANLSPVKLRQAGGRLRGIAGQPTMIQHFLSPQYYDYQERAASNTYDQLARPGGLEDMLDEMLRVTAIQEQRNPSGMRDWKYQASAMNDALSNALKSKGKEINAFWSGLIMRGLRESGAIKLDVRGREEEIAGEMRYVGDYQQWGFQVPPNGSALADAIRRGHYRSPQNPGDFVPWSELLQSIKTEGQDYGDLGRLISGIRDRGLSRRMSAQYLEEGLDRYFGGEPVLHRRLISRAPGFEEFGAIMRNAEGKEIRIDEDAYLGPSHAIMSDVTLARIEKARLDGYRFVGTWQRQPEGARNASGGLASRDDMNLPGETHITDGSRSEVINGGRRMIARATDFTELGGHWDDEPSSNRPTRPQETPRVERIDVNEIHIQRAVVDERRGGNPQQNQNAGQDFGFDQDPFGPQDEAPRQQQRPRFGRRVTQRFDPQGRVTEVEMTEVGDENFGGGGERVNQQEPPTQRQKKFGGILGAMSGIYWARRWWDIATGGVQQDMMGMGMQDFAPPALYGDRGTSYGNIISGAGTRQAIARMADQRGAYEEYGGFTDLAFANAGNRSAARMRAAASVSEGLAFGGIEIGSSIAQMGYFTQAQGGPWGEMGKTIGKAGTVIAGAGLALGAINYLGQGIMESWNNGGFGNRKPDVPLTWGEIARQVDKTVELYPIEQRLMAAQTGATPIPNNVVAEASASGGNAIQRGAVGLTDALIYGATFGSVDRNERKEQQKAAGKGTLRPEDFESEAIEQLRQTNPFKAMYFSYKGEPDLVSKSQELAEGLSLIVGGSPTDYVPSMTRLGRMLGGALPNANQVLNFGLASQRQGYGFQQYLSIAEQVANSYGFLGGTAGQAGIVDVMSREGVSTYGLDRMQENASLFQSKYSSLTRWLPQSYAAQIARTNSTSPEYYSALSSSFYASGVLGFDVNQEYSGGRLVYTGVGDGRTNATGDDRYAINERRETYAEMIARQTRGLSSTQLQPLAPIIGTMLDRYPQYTENLLGRLTPVISSLGNEGGTLLGSAMTGNRGAQSYIANFRPDAMTQSGQMYYNGTLQMSPNGAQFASYQGNPWQWGDRSGNNVYETSGQGFLSLGLGLANQGLVSQNIGSFRQMITDLNRGTFNGQKQFLLDNYGVSDNGLAESFLNNGTRGAQEYVIAQRRINQQSQIGIQFEQISNQRNYLWGANSGGTWNNPTAGSMWGLENQQRELSNRSRLADFAYSRTMMDTSNMFSIQQEGLTGQRMGVTQGYQRWNLGFNYQGQLQQRGWTREDWQYQDTTRAINFSDNMTDIDEAIRRSSGYNRRVLLRQKERLGRDFGLEEGQIEKSRDRQEEVWAREDERYKKEKAYAEELMSLDSKQFQLQKTQRETYYQLESSNLARNLAEYKEQFALQEKMTALSRQYQAEQLAISERLLAINKNNVDLENQYEDLVRKVTQQYSDWAGEVDQIGQNEQSKVIMQALTSMLNNMSGMNQNTIDALTNMMKSIAGITPSQASFVEQIYGNMR